MFLKKILTCSLPLIFQHSHIPSKHLVASWADTGKVHIWDIADQLGALDKPGTSRNQNFGDKVKPIFTFSGHQVSDANSGIL